MILTGVILDTSALFTSIVRLSSPLGRVERGEEEEDEAMPDLLGGSAESGRKKNKREMKKNEKREFFETRPRKGYKVSYFDDY